MTTTGFATTDFNLWASMPKAVMVFIMFIGACAGSTGGGLKVSRWILYNKQIYHEIERLVHPNAVSKVRLDGKVVDEKTIRSANKKPFGQTEKTGRKLHIKDLMMRSRKPTG